MAIGAPVEVYATCLNQNVGATVLNPTATIPAGSVAVAAAAAPVFAQRMTGAADSKGNTWTVDHVYTNASTRGLSIASAQITTPILTTDTISLTWALTNNSSIAIWVDYITGLLSSGILDKTADATGTGGAVSCGPTAALAQATEIALMLVEGTNGGVQTWAPGSGFTASTTAVQNGGGVTGALQYLIVSSTAAITGTGTLTGNGASEWDSTIVTYKGAATVPPTGPGEAFASAFSTAYSEDFAEVY